jgi:hypothetical protein
MIRNRLVTSTLLIMLSAVSMAQSSPSRAFAAARALTASKASLEIGVTNVSIRERLSARATIAERKNVALEALDFEEETLGSWPDMTETNTDEELTSKPFCSTVPSADCHVTKQTQCADNTLPQACTSAPGCTLNVTSVQYCTMAQKGCDMLTLPPACGGVTSVTNCTQAAAFCNVLTLPSACSTSESACYTVGGNCDTQGHFCQTITVKQSAQCTSVSAQCNATFNQQNSCAITKNLNCINTKATQCSTSATGCSKTYGYACQQTFSLRCLTYKGDASICKNNIPIPEEAPDPTGSGLSLVLMVGLSAAVAAWGFGKGA